MPSEFTEALQSSTLSSCHELSSVLWWQQETLAQSKTPPEWEQTLIQKHSAGCTKQNTLYEVMEDIYSTLLSSNYVPARVLSSLGATIGIGINTLFPILRTKFWPLFLKGLNCRWVHNRVFMSTMATSFPGSQDDERTLWYCRVCSVHWVPGSSISSSPNGEGPSKAHPGRYILKYFSKHLKKAKNV